MSDILSLEGGFLNISPLTAIVNIVVAFALCLLIAWIYKITHKGLSYSQSFVFTLVLMGTLISVVMMVIGNSVAVAFTLLGAFTIIRFRTAIKDTKDMAFIFWALVIGLAVGTSNYVIAVIATILVSLIVWFLYKFNFGSIKNHDHLLTFKLDTNHSSTDVYKSVFDKYIKTHSLLSLNAKDENKRLDFVFNIKFINEIDSHKLVNELREIVGVDNVNLISAREDIEY